MQRILTQVKLSVAKQQPHLYDHDNERHVRDAIAAAAYCWDVVNLARLRRYRILYGCLLYARAVLF